MLNSPLNYLSGSILDLSFREMPAKQLQKLINEYSPASPKRDFALALAEALAATSPKAQSDSLAHLLPGFEVVRTSLGGQTSSLTLAHEAPNSNEAIQTAALFAYHFSVEWCLLTNIGETTIINSHWESNRQWFRLPSISFQELPDSASLLEALSPEGIMAGRIDALAAEVKTVDQTIVPVDVALFDILDSWRREVLRRVPSLTGYDEKLHHLFVQLFVLRAVTLSPM